MVSTDCARGSVCWIDLGSPDTAAAAAFCGASFGRNLQSAGPEAGGYGFSRQDGDTVAAIGPLSEEGAESGWTVCFSTPDAAATAEGVEQGGGVVRVPPVDVMAAGSTGRFTDPAGGRFAVWQPGGTKGLDAVGEGNTFVRAELHTDDQEANVGFHRSLFGRRAGDPRSRASSTRC